MQCELCDYVIEKCTCIDVCVCGFLYVIEYGTTSCGGIYVHVGISIIFNIISLANWRNLCLLTFMHIYIHVHVHTIHTDYCVCERMRDAAGALRTVIRCANAHTDIIVCAFALIYSSTRCQIKVCMSVCLPTKKERNRSYILLHDEPQSVLC